jgi:flagellar export protein FliJ
MKGIATLIKLRKRALDDLRRKMVSLESQKEQLQQSSAALNKELAYEMQQAKKQADMSGFFGGFAKRIQKRQEEIADEIRSLDLKITSLNDQITEAFAELKKFEIVQENAKRRADEEERRKETILMDEVAANQHRRKEET